MSSIGILLGEDSPFTKANLVFLNYDRDCSMEMDKKEFKIMISHFFQITVKNLINLAILLNPKEKAALKKY